jgi:hypothetical protein
MAIRRFEKSGFGPQTVKIASRIVLYDPDKAWTVTEDEERSEGD